MYRKIRTTCLLAGMLLASCLGWAEQPDIADGPESEWKLVTDKHGVQVYWLNREESRLKTFRGVTRITETDEYSIAAIFDDYEAFPRWLHFSDRVVEVGRDSPVHRYMRITTHLPWPLKNRDAVVEARMVQVLTEDEESFTIHVTNQPTMLPEDEDYIRVPKMEAVLKLSRLGNDEVEVMFQVVSDPGGYVPAWAINLLARDIPLFTLQKLARMMRRDEYRQQYLDYVEVRGPGRPAELAPARSYIYGYPPALPFPDGIPLDQVNPPLRP
ncbi:MAG: hypothetical protein P1U78_09765 [Alcanivoracaceae bacterium]|nr:hypothetical protein [Alcanivoracaceae bacterium]